MDGDKERGFSNMRTAALLMIWSLPFLQVGGHEPGSSERLANAACAGNLIVPDVMHNASKHSCPSDPLTGILGRSMAEEDDSLEDDFLQVGLPVAWQSQAPRRVNLSSLAPSQDALLRSPARPYPLRC